MIPRLKHPDRKNAQSILDAAERQMAYTLTLTPTDESAFNVIRNIYECFRMLGDALLIARGIESTDHITPITELLKLKIETTRSINLIDNLRRMRHNVNYYGYAPNKAEAEDAISFAKACFEPLLKTVTNKIKLRD